MPRPLNRFALVSHNCCCAYVMVFHGFGVHVLGRWVLAEEQGLDRRGPHDDAHELRCITHVACIAPHVACIQRAAFIMCRQSKTLSFFLTLAYSMAGFQNKPCLSNNPYVMIRFEFPTDFHSTSGRTSLHHLRWLRAPCDARHLCRHPRGDRIGEEVQPSQPQAKGH